MDPTLLFGGHLLWGSQWPCQDVYAALAPVARPHIQNKLLSYPGIRSPRSKLAFG